MGLNAFFAYTVVLAMGYSYNQALVVVFLSGVFFIVITKFVLREAIVNAIPAFCAIVFMLFTYSIANGVAIGLILHCVMKALSGKLKEIKPLTLIVALIFVVRYAFVSM